MISLLVFLGLAVFWIALFKRPVARMLNRIGRDRRLPWALRWSALYGSLRLCPIAGGTGQNGAIVMIKVDVENSAGEDFQFIGGQTNLTINETTAEIDVSDKLSGRLGERVPGRATASVAIEVNFLRTDQTIAFLKGKYRQRESVRVMVFDRDSLAGGASTGTNVESCTGIIVNLTETHPDQDKSTISLEINLNNDWNDV